MSKEIIRQIVTKRFADFKGLDDIRKSYPNLPEQPIPATGQWARLSIDHVMRKMVSVTSEPCTRRTGTITIEVFERLDKGTSNISQMTDSLEEWFSFYQKDRFFCLAARTVDSDKSDSYYQSTVYIPFVYDD